MNLDFDERYLDFVVVLPDKMPDTVRAAVKEGTLMVLADSPVELDTVASIYLLFYRTTVSFFPPEPSPYPGESSSNP